MTKILSRAVVVAALAALAARPASAQGFEKASVVDKVVCRADPGQSYALYLPSAFDPARPWPVLILFDPGARGPAGIRAFREAAETYGWVLVASNNSRNGPMEDSLRAARALWVDLQGRLPVDPGRVYAGGFSGGARVASVFPGVIGQPVAGVIGCGAGLASGLAPGGLAAGAYFGLSGLADFNYGEMKGLDWAFDPAGIPHRFFFFEGSHDWPDPAGAVRALGWMEVVAMKQGARPKDPVIAAAVVAAELDEARALESAGRAYWAVERLETAGRLAEGLDLDLAGLPGLDTRVAGLKAGKEYGRFLEAEKKRDERTIEFRKEFGGAFGSVEDPDTGGPAAVGKVLQAAGIAFLRKDAKAGKTIEERSLASRLLFEFSYAAQGRASALYGQHDLGRASAYWDLAIAACEEGLPREKFLYFNRARVAAASGSRKSALKDLSSAVDKGFAEIDLLEKAVEFDAIRDTPEFREIVERIRKRPGKPFESSDPADMIPGTGTPPVLSGGDWPGACGRA